MFTQCLRRLMKFPPVEDVTVLVETACDLMFLTPEERKRVGFVSSRGELVCPQPAVSGPPAALAAAVSVLTELTSRVSIRLTSERASGVVRPTEMWTRKQETEARAHAED